MLQPLSVPGDTKQDISLLLPVSRAQSWGGAKAALVCWKERWNLKDATPASAGIPEMTAVEVFFHVGATVVYD